MKSPKRIQRQRTKGWRMPGTSIYVGLPTRWGNPYVVGSSKLASPLWNAQPTYVTDAAHAVRLYRNWITGSRMADLIPDLRGRDLVCWCPLDQPCHADALLELANPKEGQE